MNVNPDILSRRTTNKSVFSAFTIAELVLSFVILGIVAVFTMPVIMGHYSKDFMAYGLKKSYSTINQALQKMTADYDTSDNIENTGFFNSTDTFLGDNFVKYFKVSKNCGLNPGCFPAEIGLNFNSKTTIPYTTLIGNHYSFITNDNMAYILQTTGTGCISNFDGAFSTGYSGHMSSICAKLWVDVNAFRGPNKYGTDIFLFYITNGIIPSLYPAGGRDDAKKQWSNDGINITGCSATDTDGYACAGRVIGQDWSILY